jgi:hypothetical protein
MRRILLALIALACMAPAAEAARRDERGREAPGRQVQRQVQMPGVQKAQPAKATPAQAGRAAAPSRQQASRQPAARQQAALRPGDVRTSRSGLVVRGASAATVSREAIANCTRRNGRTSCAPARESIAGWQAGLPSVTYAQRECPAGTFATLARGHDDVVRCMPL